MAQVYDTSELRVRTKAAWSDPWTLQGDLQPIRASISAGNSNQTGQAVFTRFYGDTKYPTEAVYQNRGALDLDNQWVQILVPPYGNADILWQGRMLAEPRRINGNAGAGPSGIQTWYAFDGHTVLQRMNFYGSSGFAKNHTTTNDEIVEIDRVLPFNHTSTVGNRSDAKHTFPATVLDCFLFDVDGYNPASPKLWTAKDVVEYLLATRINDPPGGMPTWTATNTNLLENIVDRFEFDDPTYNVLDALKVVINRSYGVGFVVLPTEAGFNIKVFGLLDTPQTFGAVTVPANAVQHQVDINSSILDLGPVVERSFSDQYPEIIVLGNPVAICSSFDRSQLTKYWTPASEASYLDPIGGVGPWTTAQLDRARRADKFRYVYQSWFVDPSQVQIPTPQVDDDGTVTTANNLPVPIWNKEPLSWLPMYEDMDYSTDPPTYKDADGHELIPPNVWMKDSAGLYHGVTSKGIHLEMLPNLLGFRLNSTIPHYVAHGDYDPGATNATNVQPELTATDIVCTMAWEGDYRQFMSHLIPGANRLDGRKVIHVDTDMWLIAPETVIDVDHAGNLIKTPNAWMTVLDGKADLERIMAGAVGRYTLARQRLTSRQQGLALVQDWLGDLIHVINDGTNVDNIRGPLTSINWNFSPHHLTVLKTGYGELNPGELSPVTISAAAASQASGKTP